MYKIIEEYKINPKNIAYLLEHKLGFYAVQLNDDIEDYNNISEFSSDETNKKNAISCFNKLKSIV